MGFKSNFIKTALPFIILISSFLFLSCYDESSDVQLALEGTELSEFHFLKAHNPSLSADVQLQKEGNVFTSRVLHGTDIKNLIGTFKHDGLKVTVNSFDQISGKTYNDFTNIVSYTVETLCLS